MANKKKPVKKVTKKVLVTTINMAPSWSSMLLPLLKLYDGRFTESDAVKHLKQMAEVADLVKPLAEAAQKFSETMSTQDQSVLKSILQRIKL